MTYVINRTNLFSFAWTIARQELWSRRLPSNMLRTLFPDALRSAWAELKRRAVIAVEQAKEILRPSAELWAEIQTMENRTTLGHEGIARLSDLRSAYHTSCQREEEVRAAAELAEKRDLIASAKGRFATVVFIKKDGTRRVMHVQPAVLKFHLKGDDASDAARRAVATRKARHPHLLPVWDAEASAPRSVNLATISRIAVNGAVHEYAIH